MPNLERYAKSLKSQEVLQENKNEEKSARVNGGEKEARMKNAQIQKNSTKGTNQVDKFGQRERTTRTFSICQYLGVPRFQARTKKH